MLDFADIFDAKLWIIDRQLERRNLNNFQVAEMHLKKKDVFAEQARVRMLSGVKIDPPQNSGEGCRDRETDRKLAQQAGVSHDTIHRVSKDELKGLKKGTKTINGVYCQLNQAEALEVRGVGATV